MSDSSLRGHVIPLTFIARKPAGASFEGPGLCEREKPFDQLKSLREQEAYQKQGHPDPQKRITKTDLPLGKPKRPSLPFTRSLSEGFTACKGGKESVRSFPDDGPRTAAGLTTKPRSGLGNRALRRHPFAAALPHPAWYTSCFVLRKTAENPKGRSTP